jgi:hypothetical protein
VDEFLGLILALSQVVEGSIFVVSLSFHLEVLSFANFTENCNVHEMSLHSILYS